MTGILVRFSVTAALLGALSAGTALAQTSEKGAASAGLEEVVVTATRREERLQDVPISVSAFSQEKLDSQGLKNIDDLSRLSPGLTFQRNGTGSNANYNDENSDINIRGVDSAAGTSTTGIYIDDTPVQSRHIGFGAVTIFPALFDLDRVEVLRGPQGTLFGAGAEGGAVRFITPSPSMTGSTGYARAEVASTKNGDPSYEFGAAMGTALIEDVLGLRVSASFRRDGGWVDRVKYTVDESANPTLPTIAYAGTTEKASNWQQTMTLRAALKWKVTEGLSITPSLYYQRLQINDTAAYWMSLSDPSAGVYRNGNALTNPSTDPYYLGAVKVDWDVGFAQLTSNTSYLSRDQHSTSDYSQYLRATWTLYGVLFNDGTPFGTLHNTYPPPGANGFAPFMDSQRNFYQEIRLASKDASANLSWTFGLFYSHLNENIPEDIFDPTLNAETGGAACYNLDGSQDPACLANGRIYHGPTDQVEDKQLAAFGELSYRFTPTLKATVGLRYSKLDYTGTLYETGPFLGTTITSNTSASEKPVTPKAALAWQPNRDNLVYASAGKGFRPGGPNPAVGAFCGQDLANAGLPIGPDGLRQVPAQFNSDSLWSYEIGGKNTFLDHRLQINTSLFYIDWSNIQQNIYLPSCGQAFNANLGKALSRGGDIEVMWKPVNELLIDVTAAYTDAKFTKSSCVGSLTFTGAPAGEAPCTGTDPATGNPISGYPLVSKGNRLLGAPWSFTAAVEYHFAQVFSGKSPYVRLDYQHTTAQTALTPGLDYHNSAFDTTVPGLPATNNLSLRAGLRFNGFDVSLFANNLTNAHPLMFESRDIPSDCYAAGYPCGTAPGSLPMLDNLYFGRGVRPRTIGLTGTYRY